MKILITPLAIILATCMVSAKDYHVSKTGVDSNAGTQAKPFKTISAAAKVAQPGDVRSIRLWQVIQPIEEEEQATLRVASISDGCTQPSPEYRKGKRALK